MLPATAWCHLPPLSLGLAAERGLQYRDAQRATVMWSRSPLCSCCAGAAGRLEGAPARCPGTWPLALVL